MTRLVLTRTPKGKTVHLIAEHTLTTLCGRWHGVNERHVYAGSKSLGDAPAGEAWSGDPAGVCARCAKAAMY